MSISARHSKKGVSALTIWNSMVPTGVSTVIEPTDDVEPMPNWTLIIPAVLVLIAVL